MSVREVSSPVKDTAPLKNIHQKLPTRPTLGIGFQPRMHVGKWNNVIWFTAGLKFEDEVRSFLRVVESGDEFGWRRLRDALGAR